MKIYGLMVAQNESDIIADTLSHLEALGTFEKIFFFDLGSTDDTLERARRFDRLLHDPQVLDRPYTESLRFELLASHRQYFSDGDWLSIVDADELYAQDPRPLIAQAEEEHATTIATFQCEYMFTDADLAGAGDENASEPISRRRRHYLIQWSEDRFFKFVPDAGVLATRRPCSRKLLNRHYQYRSPSQIETRIRIRLANRERAKLLPGRQAWPQVYSNDWRDYVMPSRLLHRDDGELRFGLPDHATWKDYYTAKNPLSTLFPQVAIALMNEHRCEKANKSVSPSQSEAPNNPSNNIFRDDYRSHVSREVGVSLRSGDWLEALRGITVLVRHMVRWARLTGKPAVQSALRERLEHARQSSRRLFQRARGRPFGDITAKPNPIVASALTWTGGTVLNWSASVANAEVRLGAPDGPLISAQRAGSCDTGNNVADATVFFLQDRTSGRPLTADHTLSRVTVRLTQGWFTE